jgi:hypothetical protein
VDDDKLARLEGAAAEIRRLLAVARGEREPTPVNVIPRQAPTPAVAESAGDRLLAFLAEHRAKR